MVEKFRIYLNRILEVMMYVRNSRRSVEQARLRSENKKNEKLFLETMLALVNLFFLESTFRTSRNYHE